MADRPGGDRDRPRRPGRSGSSGSGARGGSGTPRGGDRGGPGGGRRQTGGPSGAGGAGFRGRPGGDPRGGPSRRDFGAEGGSERSGPSGPGGPRRGFGFGGEGRDPGRDARGGDVRGREDRPFGPRRGGPPGGRPFDRGGSPGGFGGRPGPRPPFRGIRPDTTARPPDDRADTAGRHGGSHDRPWDRPARPWSSEHRGGSDRPRPGEEESRFRDRGGRPSADRPPNRPGSGRPPYDRSGPADRRPTGQRAPFGGRPSGGRPSGDRPWHDAPGRAPDPYRPGVAPSDLLAEDEELVAGRRPVEEAFVARRPARRLLVVPQRRQALERLVLHATSLRIPVVEVEGGTLTAVAGFDGHQGIALVVEPRTWAGIDDVLARALERREPPFVLVLDSLEDPQNVGTLLRSAEAAGVHGVLFPTHRQAPLTPAAIKASAGAVEHLLLCPVDDLPGALSDLRIRGLRVAAAEADAPLTAAQADLRGPLAIVVGSEGQGLSPVVRRRADLSVRIPMRGAIGSLNAAVAGSILLFAAVAQRDPAGEGGADWPRRATFDEIAASPALDDSTDQAAMDVSSPPDADGPVTGLAEMQDGAGVAGEPTSAPASAPTRARKPAPTRAAQKRSRAGTADDATPAPSPAGKASTGPRSPRAAKAPEAPASASGRRGIKAPGPTSSREASPILPSEAGPAATTRQARGKRTKVASPTDAPAGGEPDPAPDDLLPGGPTDT